MADILSQDEVDALLSGVGGPEITASPAETAQSFSGKLSDDVSVYDFRRPDIVSKDQMRTLQMLHKTFCRYLTTNLSAYLRTIAEVNLVAVDQLTYGEFTMSLSNPSCLNIVTLKPLEGRFILEINPLLVFSMIDRLLGGSGENPPQELKPLTDIEQSILTRVLNIVTQALKDAWQNILLFDFKVVERESNPQFVQIVSSTETVVLVSIEMKIGNISGIISLCFPYIFMEPVMSSLHAQQWIAATQKKPTDKMKSSLKRNIEKTYLPLKAELGQSQLTIRELLALKVGDVVRLQNKINDNIKVSIGDKVRFTGKPGTSGRNRAVQIVSLVKDELAEGTHGRRNNS